MNLSLLIVLIFSVILCTTDQSTVEPPLENVHKNDSNQKPLIVRSIDKDNGLPKETQMAQCTISSGDIEASAQATFSKKLEGFCSTKDMIDLKQNLADLESRLHNELYDLRMMIRSLLPQNYYKDNYYRDQYRDHYRPQQSYNEPNFQQPFHRQVPAPPPQNHYRDNNNIHQTFQETSARPQTYRPPIQFKVLDTTTSKPRSQVSVTTESLFTNPPEVLNVMKNKLKSLDVGKGKTVKKMTTTTQEPSTTTTPLPPVPSKNEYTYYWKLDNFPKVFNHAKKNEIFSHVFNVKGLFLRIRAALQLMENQNLVLDIETDSCSRKSRRKNFSNTVLRSWIKLNRITISSRRSIGIQKLTTSWYQTVFISLLIMLRMIHY